MHGWLRAIGGFLSATWIVVFVHAICRLAHSHVQACLLDIATIIPVCPMLYNNIRMLTVSPNKLSTASSADDRIELSI
jgi:hypothetical protein